VGTSCVRDNDIMSTPELRDGRKITCNNTYVRTTVERAIHRHRVVLFVRNANCHLGNLLFGLFDDTPGTPFQSHEIKLYYLEDLPAHREIESVLKCWADAEEKAEVDDIRQTRKEKASNTAATTTTAGKDTKTKHAQYQYSCQQENHPRTEQQESRQPCLSPPSSPPAGEKGKAGITFADATKAPALSQATIIDPPPLPVCYVFVNGRYLSLAKIKDLFLCIAPTSKPVQVFIDYVERRWHRLLVPQTDKQSQRIHSYASLSSSPSSNSISRPSASHHRRLGGASSSHSLTGQPSQYQYHNYHRPKHQ
jgi:hypothetical protein